jgi:hypothetical protein
MSAMPHAYARVPTRRQAYVSCVLVVLATVASAVLMTAVTLAPAPPAVIPLAVIVCIGCPLGMAWSLPPSIAVIRAPRRTEHHEVAALRRHLELLPEIDHPLGL